MSGAAKFYECGRQVFVGGVPSDFVCSQPEGHHGPCPPPFTEEQALRQGREQHQVDQVALAELTAVVGAIRLVLEVDPAMTEPLGSRRTLEVIRLMLEEAPETPAGDSSSVELLVRLLKDRRLHAEISPG